MMDADKNAKLRGYVNALKALQRSTERSLAAGLIEGTGELAVRGYTGLHGKVAELLPEDFFVTDSLKLEVKTGDDDRKMLSQVQWMTTQLLTYLEGLMKENEPQRGGWGWSFGIGEPPMPPTPPTPPMPGAPPPPPTPPNPPDWRGLGRELQDQIISLTRNTLKRALTNIDIDVTTSGARGVDMRSEDLTNRSFKGEKLIGADLRGVAGEYVNFEDATLTGVNLSGANLHGGNFSRTQIGGCQFAGTNLQQANFEGAVVSGCDFNGADLTAANLDKARFVNPQFRNAIMPDGKIYDGGDLRVYGATLVTKRIHIEIDTDDDKPKRDL